MLELFLSAMTIYIIYYIMTIRKFDKYGNVKKSKKESLNDDEVMTNFMAMPVEAKFFIRKYNIELKKINNKALLKVIALILGLDVAIITIIVGTFLKEDILIQILLASGILIPSYLFSLMLLSKYFKKKGLIKDEGNKKSKRNRK